MPDRIIKESICTSETLNQLTDFEERFWHRLIVNCDDFGRFDARPAVLKARLFPLRESLTHKNITDALNRLASVGLIELYTVDGKPFLRVVTWERYQRIRAKKSKFPQPDSSCRQMTADDGECPRNPIQSNAKCEMRNSYATSAPAGETAPTLEQVTEFAKIRKSPVDPKAFFDYFSAAGWRDSEGKPVYNWQQKFIAWELRENQRPAKQSAKPGGDAPARPKAAPGENMDRMREYLRQAKEDGT